MQHGTGQALERFRQLKSVPSDTLLDFESLQLQEQCRRLLWRFQLPETELGDVAYSGQQDDSLLPALGTLSKALTHVDLETDTAALGARFDLVVLSAPSIAHVRVAATLLRPGGNLYVESPGLSAFVSRSHESLKVCLRRLTLTSSAIQRAGFEEVELFWNRPNHRLCTQTIPLKHPLIVRYAMLREGSGLGRRAFQIATDLALRLHAMQLFAPYISMVARRQRAH